MNDCYVYSTLINNSLRDDSWQTLSDKVSKTIRNVVYDNHFSEKQLAEELCCSIDVVNSILYSQVCYSPKAIAKLYNLYGTSRKKVSSIKPYALLKSFDATLITYSVLGANFTDEEIKQINNINNGAKLKKRISAIHSKGAKLVFKDYESEVFKNNLDLIDSALPIILASAVYTYYSVSKKRSCEDILLEVSDTNPLNSSNKDLPKYYRTKFTKLLEASALGMYPAKPYDDSTDAKGYIIVKDDGDIVCYHFYDRDMVRKHLFENTCFDTPSATKENRKEFCNLYKTENGELELQLNFQIRWK